MDQPEVLAPITDGTIEVVANWHSPFENVGPDQKFSSFSALLQAGGFSSLIQSLQQWLPAGALDGAAKSVNNLEGRSNITKLNSTQVFTGMPPAKIPVTAHFRAYQDANAEVRRPMDQLMAWSLPKTLAQDGIAASAARGDLQVFASEVPQIIGLKFADMLLLPLVIEGIPYPITGPRDRNGVQTQASLALTLSTLTAWDAANDWKGVSTGSNFKAFGF